MLLGAAGGVLSMTEMDEILNDAFTSAGIRLPAHWRGKRPRKAYWFKRVEGMLKRGFGVEDIAIKLHCDTEEVRAHVVFLRKTGALRRLFPRSR